MDRAEVLVVEPDPETRNRVSRTLDAMAYESIVSGSVEEAVTRLRGEGPLTLIIVDMAALLPPGQAQGDWTSHVAELRVGVQRLHSLQSPRGYPAKVGGVPVILTSTEDTAAAHAAAIDAGADAFVGASAIAHRIVLRSYLNRYNEVRRRAAVIRHDAGPLSITETFALRDDDLRNGRIGRWDAKRIASVLGVELTKLAEAIGANYSTVARTPDSEALQPKLAPFANVITLVRQAWAPEDDHSSEAAAEQSHTDTDERLRMWLRQPQPALGDRQPLDALLEPGLAVAVEQWVTRAWLGEPA